MACGLSLFLSPFRPTQCAARAHLACRILAKPSDSRIRLSNCLGVALMVFVPLPTMLRMSRYPLIKDLTAGSLIWTKAGRRGSP